VAGHVIVYGGQRRGGPKRTRLTCFATHMHILIKEEKSDINSNLLVILKNLKENLLS